MRCQVFQLCFSYLTFLQLTFYQAVRRILNFTLKNSCTVHIQHLNSMRMRCPALLLNWTVLDRLALVSFSLRPLTPSTVWPGWAEKGRFPSSAASSCNLAALPLFDYSNQLAEIAAAECVCLRALLGVAGRTKQKRQSVGALECTSLCTCVHLKSTWDEYQRRGG